MLLNQIKNLIFLSIFLLGQTVSAYSMEVAITVDDLPAHGELPNNATRLSVVEQMLHVFEKHRIKNVYGFVNAAKITNDKNNLTVLEKWVSDGQLLGNHTYSHLDLANTSTNEYIHNILMNESALKELMGNKNYRYFRYPYLAEGNTQEKRDGVRHFLFKTQYQLSPVTVDFFDYEWNAPYARCENKHDQKSIAWLKTSYIEQSLDGLMIAHALAETLFQRDIKYILLIHIGAFDALMLDDLLTAYEKHGVKFITLPEALRDPVYKINPNIVTDRTYTFLNQIRLTRKLENPAIVKRTYASLPEEKLAQLCR